MRDREGTLPEWVVILGPTAVGKSRASVLVAETLGGEIIGADSRQIYRGMDIGTAKPDPELRSRVPHHLIDFIDPHETFSAGAYREMACGTITRLQERGKIPVVVGGTGLYIRALLHGLWRGPAADRDLRRGLMLEDQAFGPGYLHQRLARVDPESALRIHPHDRAKVVRALEVAELTGTPLSRHHESGRAPGEGHRAIVLGLHRERADLYRRINARVDAMVRAGLAEEVGRLMGSGHHPGMGSMRGLGYRQIAGYLQGEYGLDRAVELIKRDTRRYAKRQMTWFRKEPLLSWIHLLPGDGDGEVCQKILKHLRIRTGGSLRPAAQLKPERVGGTI